MIELAAIILAAIEVLTPRVYEQDRFRAAHLAVGLATAHVELKDRWPRAERELWAITLATAIQESGLRENVHSGAKRGRGGDICPMQIHPGNRRRYSESLAGLELGPTTACFRAGMQTLIGARRHCKNYKTYWAEATVTTYATGNRCWPPSGRAFSRARLTRKIVGTKWKTTELHLELVRGVR